MLTGPVSSSGKLADIFSELFVVGSYLRDEHDLGAPDAFRAKLQKMFKRADEEGKAAGFTSDTLTQARYAMAAFLDEMVINSRWPHREQWSARPLQYDLFNEFTAGEGFYKHLETIRSGMPINTDLLEIYALCLIFGFEGQYRIQDRDKLRGLVEDVTREIQARRGEVPPLSPHARRPEELLDVVKRDVPVWVIMTISVGVVFFFYLALSFLISHDAGQVVDELKRLLREG